ncbi:protein vreteno [Drosophila bipectinata]|uniref:protein vreteno n=1 Tax=Drosophila bipectinata TaxID=42026 RepID=UPI001C8A6112|nr:protein vreteno [Drosophila bipectinata]
MENVEDWSKWNPMAADFYDEAVNSYVNADGPNLVDEAHVPPLGEKKEEKPINLKKYPSLAIAKDTNLVTERTLKMFLGEHLIFHIDYRKNSGVFKVYFKHIGAFETARLKLDGCKTFTVLNGRRNFQPEFSIPSGASTSPKEWPSPAPFKSLLDRSSVDLESRTYPISEKLNDHPQFTRAPLVIKADYAKGSLLAKNDASRRYLNVKYEFVLERYNAYILAYESKQINTMVKAQSGRAFLYPKKSMLVENNFIIKNDENNNEDLSKWNIKMCIACHGFTKTACKICAMPFCNAECLRAVKDKHEEFCAAKDKHEELCDPKTPFPVGEKVPSTACPNPGLPPTKGTVRITAFEQTNVVYVISTERDVEMAYFSVLQEVTSKSKNAVKLQTVPQCGQIVIYKSESQTIRAVVLNVEDPKEIYVVCMDYGNVDIAKLEDLYECSDYLAGLAVYPVAVQLRGVPRRFMNPNVRELLYELCISTTYKIRYSKREYNYKKGLQIVQLVESEFHRNLNRYIKNMITPVEPSMSGKGFKEDYFSHIYLPTGKKIQLVVMDNTFVKYGLIYCTVLDLAYEVTKMQRDLQDYGENIAKCESFAPPKGEVCVAKYKENWCRGMTQELVGDGYPSILFLDYGNIRPVHISEIRPYPAEFKFPIVTSELELIGFPEEVTDEQAARLEDYFGVGTLVNCDEVIKNEGANNYSVRFDILNRILNI